MAPVEMMVVAGEASGDQHAAELIHAIRARAPEVRFFGMGGERLANAGVDLLYSAREVSVMGITEVLPKLWRILRVMNGLTQAAKRRKPQVAILVDLPDFNLRLARTLKGLGVRVVYFIGPSVWAWRASRVELVDAYVDRMLCILPFEERFYRARGVRAEYVGSPVLDQVPDATSRESFRAKLGLPSAGRWVALLPGSRRSEIRRILPALVDAGRILRATHPGLAFIVPIAPMLDSAWVKSFFSESGLAVHFVEGCGPEAVGASDVAVVASGTATLEAGLMERPMVVVYRLSALSYAIGKTLVRLRHYALVNLLAGTELVRELIQGRLTGKSVAAEVARLLDDPLAAKSQVDGLVALRGGLGQKGAAGRAAQAVLSLL